MTRAATLRWCGWLCVCAAIGRQLECEPLPGNLALTCPLCARCVALEVGAVRAYNTYKSRAYVGRMCLDSPGQCSLRVLNLIKLDSPTGASSNSEKGSRRRGTRNASTPQRFPNAVGLLL